jgi:hypothetical protein
VTTSALFKVIEGGPRALALPCKFLGFLYCIVVDDKDVFVFMRGLVNPQTSISQRLQVTTDLFCPWNCRVVFSIVNNMQF